MNTRSMFVDGKETTDARKTVIEDMFDEDYFDPNGAPVGDKITVETPLLEKEYADRGFEKGLDYPNVLDPENEAALDPETRSIRVAQVARMMAMTQAEAMKPIRFERADLERFTRNANTWATSRPRMKRRRRAAPRNWRGNTVRRSRRTPGKRKWVPYKTWLKRQRR